MLCDEKLLVTAEKIIMPLIMAIDIVVFLTYVQFIMTIQSIVSIVALSFTIVFLYIFLIKYWRTGLIGIVVSILAILPPLVIGLILNIDNPEILAEYLILLLIIFSLGIIYIGSEIWFNEEIELKKASGLIALFSVSLISFVYLIVVIFNMKGGYLAIFLLADTAVLLISGIYLFVKSIDSILLSTYITIYIVIIMKILSLGIGIFDPFNFEEFFYLIIGLIVFALILHVIKLPKNKNINKYCQFKIKYINQEIVFAPAVFSIVLIISLISIALQYAIIYTYNNVVKFLEYGDVFNILNFLVDPTLRGRLIQNENYRILLLFSIYMLYASSIIFAFLYSVFLINKFYLESETIKDEFRKKRYLYDRDEIYYKISKKYFKKMIKITLSYALISISAIIFYVIINMFKTGSYEDPLALLVFFIYGIVLVAAPIIMPLANAVLDHYNTGFFSFLITVIDIERDALKNFHNKIYRLESQIRAIASETYITGRLYKVATNMRNVGINLLRTPLENQLKSLSIRSVKRIIESLYTIFIPIFALFPVELPTFLSIWNVWKIALLILTLIALLPVGISRLRYLVIYSNSIYFVENLKTDSLGTSHLRIKRSKMAFFITITILQILLLLVSLTTGIDVMTVLLVGTTIIYNLLNIAIQKSIFRPYTRIMIFPEY